MIHEYIQSDATDYMKLDGITTCTMGTIAKIERAIVDHGIDGLKLLMRIPSYNEERTKVAIESRWPNAKVQVCKYGECFASDEIWIRVQPMVATTNN